mmetsp:Transcript_9197/g.30326  ORF Transcript_9197/g.30326 Transcript_9197/m.30326 type:complete len:204 (+) Transcript_9197:3584-4195(+)
MRVRARSIRALTLIACISAIFSTSASSASVEEFCIWSSSFCKSSITFTAYSFPSPELCAARTFFKSSITFVLIWLSSAIFFALSSLEALCRSSACAMFCCSDPSFSVSSITFAFSSRHCPFASSTFSSASDLTRSSSWSALAAAVLLSPAALALSSCAVPILAASVALMPSSCDCIIASFSSICFSNLTRSALFSSWSFSITE